MININDMEFHTLCEYMRSHYGLNLVKKRVLIEYRLMNILQKYQVTSFQEYFRKVFQDKSGEMEAEMVNRITTNYSFFLREPQHFTFIKEQILPTLSMQKPFQIWIAGCSQGQECFTLAMMLEECKHAGMVVPHYQIYATDVNSMVLHQAKKGIFPIEAMEPLPAFWKEHYCVINEAKQTFQVTNNIRNKIKFQKQNLKGVKETAVFDLIMCRNVLIYFDTASRMEIYQTFYQSLKKKGYLILGLAEMIPQGNGHFHYLGSSIYQVREETPL